MVGGTKMKIRCPKCDYLFEIDGKKDNLAKCPNCLNEFRVTKANIVETETINNNIINVSINNYPALEVISGIFSFIFYFTILLLIGAIIYIIIPKNVELKTSLYILLEAIGIFVLIGLPFKAFAELIKLFIDIEYNTRNVNYRN